MWMTMLELRYDCERSSGNLNHPTFHSRKLASMCRPGSGDVVVFNRPNMIAACGWRLVFLLFLTQNLIPISWADGVQMSSASPQARVRISC